MTKDVNIHVKATGTQEVKQGLDGVAHSAEQMGTKTSRASSWIMDGLKSLIGPLGFAAIATAAASAALKVAKFFDNIKTRADEAVRSVQELRNAYADLFEALDAFDEKSRKTITEQTSLLLQKTAVTKELGLPVITAYTRQFRGRMPQEQYEQGLQEMLTYGARRNVEPSAMADLISIMAGWGMNTSEQQGQFRRMISAASQQAGLTEEDMINALSRGMPTIKAMGWTPEQAIESIATLAAGEVGRKKTQMPAATLEALMTPELKDVRKFGISEKVAKDPQQLLAALQAQRGKMTQKAFLDRLIAIYGAGAAPGVYKLITAEKGDIAEILKQAAGPVGKETEQKKEEARKTTSEAMDAETKAAIDKIKQDLTEDEKYMEKVREKGAAKREVLRRRKPIDQWLTELFTIGEEKEKEEAALELWMESLSPEEKKNIRKQYSLSEYWKMMSPQQKYEALRGKMPQLEQPIPPAEKPATTPKKGGLFLLEKVGIAKKRAIAPQLKQPFYPAEKPLAVAPVTEEGMPQLEQPVRPAEKPAAAPVIVNNTYNYSHDTHFHPRVGSDEQGPRFSQD